MNLYNNLTLDINEQEKIHPFLKWAGGKRWLIYKYPEVFPDTYHQYLEPFVGGGAIYFYLKPKKAIIGDLNKELIDTYQALKNNSSQVELYLKLYQKKHSKEHYYQERAKKYLSLYKRAARLIYLNRTCWNGLYRVNLKGQFNVPIGTKTNILLKDDNFSLISKQLSNTEILHTDFEKIIEQSNFNDFLFVDPPYTVSHNQNAFIKYNEQLFSWQDQERLFKKLVDAKNRGVKILSTNAAHEKIITLYENNFDIQRISRSSTISSKVSSRKNYEEILIKANY